MALALRSPSPAVNWQIVFTEPGLSSIKFDSDYPIIWQVLSSIYVRINQVKSTVYTNNWLILRVLLVIFPLTSFGKNLLWKANIIIRSFFDLTDKLKNL